MSNEHTFLQLDAFAASMTSIKREPMNNAKNVFFNAEAFFLSIGQFRINLGVYLDNPPDLTKCAIFCATWCKSITCF